IFGSRPSVDLAFPGANNDLHIESTTRGPGNNGVNVSFVNNNAIVPGHETVAYNSVNKTLVFQVSAGHTTANDIVNALNNDPVAGQVFRASLTGRDTSSGTNVAGTGQIDPSVSGVTAGGGGFEPDLTSGLQIVNGGKTYTVDLSSAKTIGDL